MNQQPADPYARSEYRRLIAWDSRIERERSLLLSLLESAPDRSVLDIGCGTGEHVAFMASSGARGVGLDRSEAMIERASEHEARGEGRFVLGDAGQARQALGEEPPFGLALCLGNMLPHVLTIEALRGLLAEIHACLLPGGRLLLQILNYRRIVERGIRALPVNVRPGEGDTELVFVRLMKPVSDETILFFPSTLVLDPSADEPVQVKSTRRVELRPWQDEGLSEVFEELGFEVELYGDMQGGTYAPMDSHDLVIVAKR